MRQITIPSVCIFISYTATHCDKINPYSAKINYLNFHPLVVVSRYREPQLQVGENYSYFCNLTTKKCANFDV